MRARTEDRLLSRTAAAQSDGRLPSLAAGVVRDGRLAWWAGRGRVTGPAVAGDPAPAPPDPQVQYRMGSITKTVVAVAVMRLRDEGRIDLADPLDRHLTGTSLGGRTLAQLLSHSSGLRAETAGPWWERTPGSGFDDLVAASLGPASLLYPAGRRFHYSNVGFALLGRLLAQQRGKPWSEVVTGEVLAPLGMTRTTTRPVAPRAWGFAVHPWADVLLPEPEHDAGAMAPAGQLWTSLADLAALAAFLTGDTGDVLHPDTLAEMSEPQAVEDGPDGITGAYGLGLMIGYGDRRRTIGHGGSMPGFLAGVIVDPAVRDAAVVLANATSGLDAGLPTALLDVLADEEPALAVEWRPVGSPGPEVLELLGPWFWGPVPFALRWRTDGLLDLVPLQARARASRFRPCGDGTWRGLDGYYAGEALRPGRRPDGSVGWLDLASFVFTREPYDPGAPVPGGVDPGGWR